MRHKASFLALQDSEKHFWWRPDLDAGCLRFISLFCSSWVLPTEHHLLFEISTRLLPDGSLLSLGAVLMSAVMFVHMIVLLIAGIYTHCGRLCYWNAIVYWWHRILHPIDHWFLMFSATLACMLVHCPSDWLCLEFLHLLVSLVPNGAIFEISNTRPILSWNFYLYESGAGSLCLWS